MVRRDLARSCIGLALVASVSACTQSGSPEQGPSNPMAPGTTVTSVTVTGTAPSVGATSQLAASALMSNGQTATVTAQAVWESTNTAVVTVSPTGLATGVAAGAADIRATYQGVTGALPVNVLAPTLLVIGGTIFIDPDIITPADPTAFTGLTYAGTGDRLMFDRRVAAFVTYHAFLFDATFADGRFIEIQVNPEFGSSDAALVEAQKYGRLIGQLPTALREDVKTMWIHQGVQLFGGGNDNVLVHTGQAANYESSGILEEVLVHEAAHSSLDRYHASAPGWRQAQTMDGDFISTYAADFPDREDIAESVLPWIALRYRESRISGELAHTIRTRMPNRLIYFDNQMFAMFPID